MKKDKQYKDILDWFAAPPTVNQRAWGVVHDFLHQLLDCVDYGVPCNTDLRPGSRIITLVKLADKHGYEIEIKLKKTEK